MARTVTKDFPAAVLGNDYPGWPGEKFVDIRAKAVRDIMAKRFDVCKQKGFDGVEPDNMDVYGNRSGFPLTEQDGKWVGTFMIPAGDYEVKVALDGGWDTSYGVGGGGDNYKFTVAKDGNVTFTFDPATKLLDIKLP